MPFKVLFDFFQALDEFIRDFNFRGITQSKDLYANHGHFTARHNLVPRALSVRRLDIMAKWIRGVSSELAKPASGTFIGVCLNGT